MHLKLNSSEKTRHNDIYENVLNILNKRTIQSLSLRL